jgi:hypothetical protein
MENDMRFSVLMTGTALGLGLAAIAA